MITDTEKSALQRRIKNQRRELRRLVRTVVVQKLLLEQRRLEKSNDRVNHYRHAAVIAESFWFGGRRIGAYIRKWMN